MTTKTRMVRYTACGFFIFVIDQILKYIARTNPATGYYLIEPYLGWEYLGNPGIAFGLPIPNWFLLITTPLLILGLFVWLTKTYRKKYTSLGLTLIIAGAVSNLIDRILFEVTIDYIRVVTSVFNLADVSIVVGVILLFFNDITKKRV